MRLIAIETATEWCSVALWHDGETAALETRAGNRHAERVLPMLERLLASAGISIAQLDAVNSLRLPGDGVDPRRKLLNRLAGEFAHFVMPR